MLPDGSVVELNDGAVIREAFTADSRRVELLGGEAHFTVTKNPARPFVVAARGVEFRAVGTAFAVDLRSREVEVIVTEGRVAVATAAAAAANIQHSTSNIQRRTAKAVRGGRRGYLVLRNYF